MLEMLFIGIQSMTALILCSEQRSEKVDWTEVIDPKRMYINITDIILELVDYQKKRRILKKHLFTTYYL